MGVGKPLGLGKLEPLKELTLAFRLILGIIVEGLDLPETEIEPPPAELLLAVALFGVVEDDFEGSNLGRVEFGGGMKVEEPLSPKLFILLTEALAVGIAIPEVGFEVLDGVEMFLNEDGAGREGLPPLLLA